MAYVIPYDKPWALEPELCGRLGSYRSLRLMGKPKDTLDDVAPHVSHAEILYLSRVPKARAELFGAFPNLIALELDYCMIENLDGIQHVPCLRFLKLTECRKLANLGALREASVLRGLRFALCNQVGDYSPIGSMNHLQYLTIEAKSCSNLSFLNSLRSLENVTLNLERVENPASFDPAALVNLRCVSLPNKRWAKQVVECLRNRESCEVTLF